MGTCLVAGADTPSLLPWRHRKQRRRPTIRQPSREQHAVKQSPTRALPPSMVVCFACVQLLTDGWLCCHQSASDLVTLVVLQPLRMHVGTTACISVLQEHFRVVLAHQTQFSELPFKGSRISPFFIPCTILSSNKFAPLLDVLFLGLGVLQV